MSPLGYVFIITAAFALLVISFIIFLNFYKPKINITKKISDKHNAAYVMMFRYGTGHPNFAKPQDMKVFCNPEGFYFYDAYNHSYLTTIPMSDIKNIVIEDAEQAGQRYTNEILNTIPTFEFVIKKYPQNPRAYMTMEWEHNGNAHQSLFEVDNLRIGVRIQDVIERATKREFVKHALAFKIAKDHGFA